MIAEDALMPPPTKTLFDLIDCYHSRDEGRADVYAELLRLVRDEGARLSDEDLDVLQDLPDELNLTYPFDDPEFPGEPIVTELDAGDIRDLARRALEARDPLLSQGA